MKYLNRKTKITASAIGALLGLSGILNHGVFEILQGNISTYGFFIDAIGEAHRFWQYGTEGAFTIVHNFLITGILAVLVGLTIVYWSLKYIHLKHGRGILLSLFVLLNLVGGGLGYIVLIIPTLAFATRINKSLDWWKNVFPDKWRKLLSAIWIYGLATTLVSWLIVMELGIFGYFPGEQNPDKILTIVFIFLFSTVFLTCLTFIFAIAGDLWERDSN